MVRRAVLPSAPPEHEGGGAAKRPQVAMVDCGSKKVPELGRLIEELGARCRTISLTDAARYPFVATDAVVVSGGPHLFLDEPLLVDRFAFIDDIVGPVLGICLGHQAIALRHGASVFRGAERRGPERVHIVEEHPLVAALGASATLFADHCEGVTLPEGFSLLGRSEHYAVEVMACEAKRRYGVQCHPEVSGAAGRRLLAAFLAHALSRA